MLSISQRIADELSVRESQIASAIAMLDEGSTVPFIARYRKEATGGLDDTQLRTLEERLGYLRELEDRRASILSTIQEQGKLTPELERQIKQADTKTRLEDLYLPYKQKRRTKAQIAREAGLEPLADALLADPTKQPEAEAAAFVDAEKGVADIKAVLDGARHILVERFGEDAELVGRLRTAMADKGVVTSKVIEEKKAEGAKFSDYFDFSENWSKLPSHRALALFRGRAQGVLDIRLDLPVEEGQPHPAEGTIAVHTGIRDQGRPADKWLSDVVRWTWKLKIGPHIETDLMGSLRERAEDEAIRVFARNLHDLLLAAPAGQRATIGLDPGIRTGVKVAVVDSTGKLVETTTIYPHPPRNDWDGSIAVLAALAARHKVELISIGNGTASRETDKLAADLMKRHPELSLTKLVVSEAGASVYSASETAAHEFPGLDVSLRGAVSIARRLQDPLAELVKIEPKSIGVGQYQHDVAGGKLARSLDAVVEDCVNAVGVDLNTASIPLLTRVSGLNETIARNIVEHRDRNGAFRSRKQLLDVARLGPKTFEQAAGFLRIRDGENPLDGSAVHRPGSRQRHRRRPFPARPECGGVHRRAVRRPHRRGHHQGAGEARPRPASGVQDRHLQGGRGRTEAPAAWHDAGGCGDQRHRLRRLRRYRRPPGRAGAYFPACQQLREGSSHGGEGRRRGEGEGAGGGHPPQAHRPDHAHGRGSPAPGPA